WSAARSSRARAIPSAREQEFTRLAEALPPTLEALRALTLALFQEQVGAVFERLAYVILSYPTVRDLVLTVVTLHFSRPGAASVAVSALAEVPDRATPFIFNENSMSSLMWCASSRRLPSRKKGTSSSAALLGG